MIRLFARSPHYRILQSIGCLQPVTVSVRSKTAPTNGTPFVKNEKAQAEWRKNLTRIPLKSPFHPMALPTTTMAEAVFESLEDHAKNQPEVPAIIDVSNGGKTISYAGLLEKSKGLAGFLKSRGISKSDKISITMPNCFEWPIGCLGIWASGGTIIGTSSLFTPYELSKQYADSDCKMVITSESLIDKVVEAAKSCPQIKTIICHRTSDKLLPEGVFDFDEVVKHTPIAELHKYSLSDDALILYSSGTTGPPKGTVISQLAFNSNVAQFINHWENEVFPVLDVDKIDYAEEYQMLNLPFYHIFGFGLMNWFFTTGSPIVLMDKFDPVAYLGAIQKFKIRMIFIVPPILVFLAKHPIAAKFDLSTLELVICGSAPAGKDICDEFVARFPNVKFVCQGFGMTEIGISHLPFLDSRSSGSCGIISSLSEQKLVDHKDEPVAIGEKGELCVRGPTLMTEYFKRPEETAKTFDADGWLHTGDIAYMDDKGMVYIVDRLKELIKVKGMQIAPAEVEDVLLSHPQIVDVAVVGVPDEKLGERVRAFVVRKDNTVTGDMVREYVAEKLSEFKHITGGVKFVKQIPKSASGKILRRLLKDVSLSNEDENEP